MKITIVHVDDLNEMEITIRHNNPSEAARIKRLLEASQFKLEVKDSSAIDTTEVLMIDPHQIYYFESVTTKSFVIWQTRLMRLIINYMNSRRS